MGLLRPEHVVVNGRVILEPNVTPQCASESHAACTRSRSNSSTKSREIKRSKNGHDGCTSNFGGDDSLLLAAEDQGTCFTSSASSPSSESSRGKATLVDNLLDFAQEPPSPSVSGDRVEAPEQVVKHRHANSALADERSTEAQHSSQKETILEDTSAQVVTQVEEAGSSTAITNEVPVSADSVDPPGMLTQSEEKRDTCQGIREGATSILGAGDVPRAVSDNLLIKGAMSGVGVVPATTAQESLRDGTAAGETAKAKTQAHAKSHSKPSRKRVFVSLRHLRKQYRRACKKLHDHEMEGRCPNSLTIGRRALLRNLTWLRVMDSRAVSTESGEARTKEKRQSSGAADMPQNPVVPPVADSDHTPASTQSLLAQTIQAASVGSETTQAQADLLTAVEQALAADDETPEQAALLSAVEDVLAVADVSHQQAEPGTARADTLEEPLSAPMHRDEVQGTALDAQEDQLWRAALAAMEEAQSTCGSQDQHGQELSTGGLDAKDRGSDAQTTTRQQFSPVIIASDCCLARTKTGDQCRNPLWHGGNYCKLHFQNDKWRIYGRIDDDPIPEKKVAAFKKYKDGSLTPAGDTLSVPTKKQADARTKNMTAKGRPRWKLAVPAEEEEKGVGRTTNREVMPGPLWKRDTLRPLGGLLCVPKEASTASTASVRLNRPMEESTVSMTLRRHMEASTATAPLFHRAS